MLHSKISVFISLAVLVIGCKDAQITGQWTRIWPDSIKRTRAIGKGEGDLTISPDATFFIKGNSIKSTNDTIPGWHVGADEGGYWKMPDSNHLVFYYDSTFRDVYMPGTITHLSKKRLEIYFFGSSWNIKKYIRE